MDMARDGNIEDNEDEENEDNDDGMDNGLEEVDP